MIELHPDFKEFLRLLHSKGVRYLLIGGYAVSYYGYPRATGDMDIWIAVDDSNADNIIQAILEFGMPPGHIQKEVFLQGNNIIRMGLPPVRIKVLTSVSGVNFDECFNDRETLEIGGFPIHVISLQKLKINKKASGRLKDLDDLRHLP